MLLALITQEIFGSTWVPISTVPHAEAMVQAILGTQPGPALPRLEKMHPGQVETSRLPNLLP